ncbi:hypothetical protein EMPS_05624 [Entomortierella parvispora]|uniref:Protein kinase domain-containing protein n=1 Tax=Entomortierella parvispora TaxID=205924 RepID=A0A9P3HAR5_9FUNG|nr:hypothetical protein EMPS_05624 [Entomortierella parvispora]
MAGHAPDTLGLYARHPRPFAGGSAPDKPLIFTCKRKDIPEEAQEFPLVLKMISRSSLTSLFDMPEEDRMTQPPETVEGFDEQMMAMEIEKRPDFKHSLSEVAALRALDHPRILRFVGCYWTHEHANIVMEFARGGDLQKRMNDRQEIGYLHYSEEELVPIIRMVCNTLHFVHDSGWAHRDLKPSKIMFRTQLNDDVVIAGFGFAIFQENTDGGRSLFTTTDVGTPEFKAPEQFRDEGYGISVDMWALGVTCFYLLTGSYPFGAGAFDFSYGPSVMGQLKWDAFGFSDNAKDFIGRLLVWDPDSRMTSAETEHHPWLADVADPGAKEY